MELDLRGLSKKELKEIKRVLEQRLLLDNYADTKEISEAIKEINKRLGVEE